MQNSNELDQGIRQLVHHAWRRPLIWLLPAFVIGGLGLAYAVVYQPNWVASQALNVREDHMEGSEWIGQFNEAERLKHAQETFLELARSPSVVAAALKTVGPPASCKQPQQWPSSEDVAATREQIEVLAPNGLEFGTTRMFYLAAADPEPQRAKQLATAICDESENRFKQLRDQQTRDAIAELTNNVELASQELERESRKLQEMETRAGSDLAELRMLSESLAGASNLQTTLSEVQQELRQAESMFTANQQLLSLLTSAQEDPSNLVATPNRLLEAQPALRRLKEGLIDAQLQRSQLLGTMSAEHPRVQAAHAAEAEIRGHLHQELDVAVRGLRAEQVLCQSQIDTLTAKANDLQQRLKKLAEMRASYATQLAEVREQTESLTASQQELNVARARLSAGDVVSLVTRVDTPQTGAYAEGPGRSMIAAAAGLGGLLVGFGLLLLTMPSVTPVTSQAPSQNEPPSQPNQAPQATESLPTPDVPPKPTPTPSVRPLAPHTAPLPSIAPTGRSMTLKEALIRCSNTNETWQS